MRTATRRLLSLLLLASLALGVSACPWWRHDGDGEHHDDHRDDHHDDHHDDDHHDGDRR